MLHDSADVDLISVEEGVNVDLDGVFEEPVDEDRTIGRDLRGAGHVVEQLGAVVDDLHSASAEDVGGTHEHRVADVLGDRCGFAGGHRGAVLGCGESGPVEDGAEFSAVLGQVDGFGLGA